MYVRGFRGAVLADDGTGIGDFPKEALVNHSLVVVNPMNNSAQALQEIPEKGARQYGRFLLTRRSLKEEPKQGENEKKLDEDQGDEESSNDFPLNKEVRFELRDLIKNKTVWSREFPKEAPGSFVDQFSGRLILQWPLHGDAGKARLKEDSALAARAKELENKDNDYLMEVVDCFAGKSVGAVLLETGRGSFYIKSGFSEKDWLVLNDSNNRILVYSMKDGDLHHRFFGANAVMNPARNQIVIENFPGELTFYDLDTGDSQAALSLASPAAFVRFSLDGKKLFALSRDQIAYAFDVDKLVSKTSAQ